MEEWMRADSPETKKQTKKEKEEKKNTSIREEAEKIVLMHFKV